MTSSQQVKTRHSLLLAKQMTIGAMIGLILISFFLITAGDGNPEWHPYWWIRPLVVVPYAGAMAGVFYHLMDQLRYQGGWKKLLANALSFIVLVIGLWLGSVLGLAGTYWN